MTVMTTIIRGDIDNATLSAIHSSGRIACDIETTGLDPHRDRIGTVQIHVPGLGEVVIQATTERPSRLCSVMEDPKVQKVFHHAMFDLRFMAAQWEVSATNVACTKIASKLLDRSAANDRHSLQALLQHRLGVHIDKSQRLSNWLAADLSDEQVQYAMADVVHLLPLLNTLEGELREAGMTDLFRGCLDFIPTRVHLDLGKWPDVFLY